MSAMPFNPTCKAFAERLAAQGKPSIVIIGAIMKNLLISSPNLTHRDRDFFGMIDPTQFRMNTDLGRQTVGL